LTRGQLGTTAAVHSAGADIHTTIVQISGTDEGGTPSFYTLTFDSEVSVDEDGKIYIFDDTLYSNTVTGNNLLSKQDVPNRLRISYYYGWDTIPVDITRLTLLMAAKEIMHVAVRKAHSEGKNDFRPTLVAVDDEEIAKIVGFYQNWNMSNT
jgi:hypothetical protein